MREKNKLIEENPYFFCMLILCVGTVLRLFYAWQVPYNVSPHDLGVISDGNGTPYGHMGYIQFLNQTKKLPETVTISQYYHPPLFHITGAIILELAGRAGCSAEAAFEILQYVNMIFASIAVIYIFRILKKLEISEKGLVALTAYLTMHPVFYNLGSALNNDCLMTMFCIMAIYYTVCWIQDISFRNIFKIAVCIAFGMLSKTSAVLISPAIAVVFLTVLINKRKQKDVKKLILQFCAFGAVCIPLGMSWVVRNKVLFGVPFNYVLRSNDAIRYIGDLPLMQRMGLPSLNQIFSVKIDWDIPKKFSNIWGQTAITMVYDEGILNIHKFAANVLAVIAKWINSFIYVYMIIASAKMCFVRKIKGEYRWLISLGFAVLMGSFISFSFQYPYVFTINFRYIVCTLVFLGMGMGLEKTNSRNQEKGINTVIQKSVICGMFFFSIAESLLYLLCAV